MNLIGWSFRRERNKLWVLGVAIIPEDDRISHDGLVQHLRFFVCADLSEMSRGNRLSAACRNARTARIDSRPAGQLPTVKGGAKSGKACEHWDRLDQDLGLIQELGVGSYRCAFLARVSGVCVVDTHSACLVCVSLPCGCTGCFS